MNDRNRSLLEFIPNSKQHPEQNYQLGDFRWINKDTVLEKIYLNWTEKELPERLRTKHVHRLHPYLGKYIPHLVEVFLRKFRPNYIFDPFMGSGTTLVESNVLGIPSGGCDISSFNCLISKVKTDEYDILLLEKELKDILNKTVNILSNHESKKLLDSEPSNYLHEWFHENALTQLLNYRSLIDNYFYKDVMKIILTRSARSARLTRHFDLDFPKKPFTESYHCYKHHRLCRPTDDALGFLKRYTVDTINRIKEFSLIRTNSPVEIIHGNSKTTNFSEFDAMITSPPYMGLIDYHAQHKYAYELLKLPERNNEEIGSASNGNSIKSKNMYTMDITKVLSNVKNSLKPGGIMIIVVHDKYEIYPNIAKHLDLEQMNILKREVNRRTGRRASNFFEQIYIWKKKS